MADQKIIVITGKKGNYLIKNLFAALQKFGERVFGI
jgi:hypothetical protein